MTITAQTINLSVFQGQSFFYQFQATDTSGLPPDLTGCFLTGFITDYAGVIHRIGEHNGYLSLNKASALITFILPPTNTGLFSLGVGSYVINAETPIGSERTSITIASGSFNVIDPAYPISAATAWDDLRVGGYQFRTTGGLKAPDLAAFKDNGSGSHGTFIYWFDKTTIEDVMFELQMPHSWKEGTNIYPHVHFVPKTNGGAGLFPVWGLEYSIASVGGTFGNTTIIYTDASDAAHATIQGDSSLTAFKHYISAFPAIAMSGKTASAMLVCRLFRDATAGTDDYDDDAGVLEFDLHYEIDGFGSKDAYSR